MEELLNYFNSNGLTPELANPIIRGDFSQNANSFSNWMLAYKPFG